MSRITKNNVFTLIETLTRNLQNQFDNLTIEQIGINLIFVSQLNSGTIAYINGINTHIRSSMFTLTDINIPNVISVKPSVINAKEFIYDEVNGKAVYKGSSPIHVNIFARASIAEIEGNTNVFEMAIYVNNQIYPNENARVTSRVENDNYSSGGLIMTLQAVLNTNDTIELRLRNLQRTEQTKVVVDSLQLNIMGQRIKK